MLEHSLSKEELWRLRINDYRSCGLTAAEWCSKNQFPVSTLRYWIHRLNKKQHSNVEDTRPVFAELPVLTATSFLGAAPVTVYMGKVRIEIMDSCHFDLLSNLIGILSHHA
jgi:hypothetical protein